MTGAGDNRLLLDPDIPLHAIPVSAASLQLAFVPVFVTFLMYWLCLPPHLPGELAGDLVTSVVAPDAVPDGNGLWRGLAGFVHGAVGSETPTWRLSLLSAICAALAVAC